MKLFISILLVLFISILPSTIFAQSNLKRPNPELQKLKVEMVIDKMQLTSTQSEKFLPLYEQYSLELYNVRRAQRELNKNENIDATKKIQERQKLDEKSVLIKGKYNEQFLKIISPQQLASMHEGEADFRKILVERLKRDGK